MRRRRIAATAGAAAMLGLAGAPFSAAQAADLYYVSGPGGAFSNYTVPALVIRAGDTVTYANADIAPHDVVATVAGPDDRPWCNPLDPTKPEGPLNMRQYPIGQCPIIWTPLITLGQTTQIRGLDSLKPGDQIPFTCSLHSNMDGTLIVSPA